MVKVFLRFKSSWPQCSSRHHKYPEKIAGFNTIPFKTNLESTKSGPRTALTLPLEKLLLSPLQQFLSHLEFLHEHLYSLFLFLQCLLLMSCALSKTLFSDLRTVVVRERLFPQYPNKNGLTARSRVSLAFFATSLLSWYSSLTLRYSSKRVHISGRHGAFAMRIFFHLPALSFCSSSLTDPSNSSATISNRLPV